MDKEYFQEQNELLREQNKILQQQLDLSLFSHAPFASLLQTELHSFEDMDGNGLLFCIDFIFDVPYSHLSPMLKNACQMYWTDETEAIYNAYRAAGDSTKDIIVLSFEQYRDGVTSQEIKNRVNNYIVHYYRILDNYKNRDSQTSFLEN